MMEHLLTHRLHYSFLIKAFFCLRLQSGSPLKSDLKEYWYHVGNVFSHTHLADQLRWKVISFKFVLLRNALVNSKSVGAWLSLARVPALGAGGRWFESSRPDHSYQQLTTS